jgi:hypothetical protein
MVSLAWLWLEEYLFIESLAGVGDFVLLLR